VAQGSRQAYCAVVMTAAINSRAFEDALLRSERLRIFGAITIIAVFGVSSGIRIYLFGSHMSHVAWYGAVAMVAYELLVLRAVDRAIKTETDIAEWFWILNIIIEISIPALGVAFLVSNAVIQDYRPLASPWVLLFFPFLILSTLRLSPVLSIIAGLVGSLEYIAAAYYIGWHIHPDLETNSAAHSAVPFFAIMICACGFLAALVASEVRKHVEAALREAETERQLKQMEHDLTIARSIQQSLLPKVRPHIDGYEIAGWNRSADATGGDYFDWKQMEDGRLVVTLADVTGHGIGPALLASVCRAYARASFSNSEPLADSMQRINQSFGEDLSPGRFATFVAAVCNPGSDKLELLSAGHAPLFWYSHSMNTVLGFDAHDVPLGILPQLSARSSQVVSMTEGDIVFLITDGFLEWENRAAEQFGLERFERVVRSVSHLGPEEIIAEIYDEVLKFADGTPQADDLTAVVIKRTGAAKPVVAAATAAAPTTVS
jgi:serine phosphatase RsbU (regulator of sigma subunit)